MAEIQLDFDGTVVEHAYPEIGLPNPGAIEVILKLQKKGHKIILNTMRANFKNGLLNEAILYLQNNGFTFLDSEINKAKVEPVEWNMTSADSDVIFIDDIAKDIPLTKAKNVNGYMVDWIELERQLIAMNIL